MRLQSESLEKRLALTASVDAYSYQPRVYFQELTADATPEIEVSFRSVNPSPFVEGGWDRWNGIHANGAAMHVRVQDADGSIIIDERSDWANPSSNLASATAYSGAVRWDFGFRKNWSVTPLQDLDNGSYSVTWSIVDRETGLVVNGLTKTVDNAIRVVDEIPLADFGVTEFRKERVKAEDNTSLPFTGSWYAWIPPTETGGDYWQGGRDAAQGIGGDLHTATVELPKWEGIIVYDYLYRQTGGDYGGKRSGPFVGLQASGGRWEWVDQPGREIQPLLVYDAWESNYYNTFIYADHNWDNYLVTPRPPISPQEYQERPGAIPGFVASLSPSYFEPIERTAARASLGEFVEVTALSQVTYDTTPTLEGLVLQADAHDSRKLRVTLSNVSDASETFVFQEGVASSDGTLVRNGLNWTVSLSTTLSQAATYNVTAELLTNEGSVSISDRTSRELKILVSNSPAEGLPVITNSASEPLTAEPSEGDTLGVDLGGIVDGNGFNPATVSYQWYEDGQPIANATSPSYVLSKQSSVTKKISVRVQFFDNDGFNEQLLSAQTLPVANVNDPLTGDLRLTGDFFNGGTIGVLVNELSDRDGTASFAYEWQISDDGFQTSTVLATTLNTVLPTEAAGKSVRVQVTHVDNFGNQTTLTSNVAQVQTVNYPVDGFVSLTRQNASNPVSQKLNLNPLTIDASGLTDPDGIATIRYGWEVRASGQSDWVPFRTGSTENVLSGSTEIPEEFVLGDIRGHAVVTDAFGAETVVYASEVYSIANWSPPVFLYPDWAYTGGWHWLQQDYSGGLPHSGNTVWSLDLSQIFFEEAVDPYSADIEKVVWDLAGVYSVEVTDPTDGYAFHLPAGDVVGLSDAPKAVTVQVHWRDKYGDLQVAPSSGQYTANYTPQIEFTGDFVLNVPLGGSATLESDDLGVWSPEVTVDDVDVYFDYLADTSPATTGLNVFRSDGVQLRTTTQHAWSYEYAATPSNPQGPVSWNSPVGTFVDTTGVDRRIEYKYTAKAGRYTWETYATRNLVVVVGNPDRPVAYDQEHQVPASGLTTPIHLVTERGSTGNASYAIGDAEVVGVGSINGTAWDELADSTESSGIYTSAKGWKQVSVTGGKIMVSSDGWFAFLVSTPTESDSELTFTYSVKDSLGSISHEKTVTLLLGANTPPAFTGSGVVALIPGDLTPITQEQLDVTDLDNAASDVLITLDTLPAGLTVIRSEGDTEVNLQQGDSFSVLMLRQGLISAVLDPTQIEVATLHLSVEDFNEDLSTPATTTIDFVRDKVAEAVASGLVLELGPGIQSIVLPQAATQEEGICRFIAPSGQLADVTFTSLSGSVTKSLQATGSYVAVSLTGAEVAALGEGLVTVTVETGDAGSTVEATLTFNLASTAYELAAINEDEFDSAGAMVSDIIGVAGDGHTGGLAIISQTTNPLTVGSWQFSTDDGATWTSFIDISASNAQALPVDARIRFVPVWNFAGTPVPLLIRQTSNSITNPTRIDLSSASADTSWTAIRPVGIAVLEQPESIGVTNELRQLNALEGSEIVYTVSDWLGTAWQDTTGVGLGGIVVRSAESNHNTGGTWFGDWQWSSDGITWSAIENEYNSGTNGLVLLANDLIRFRAGANGTLAWQEGFVPEQRLRYWAFDGSVEGLASGELASSPGTTGWYGTGDSTNTVSAEITSVSDAPSGADTTLTVLGYASHTFAAADFGFTDPNDSPAGTLVSVTITTLPSGGDLKLNDVAVTAGQVVAVADLGNLVYTPAADANGVNYDSLTFQVQDNGGTADGGVDLDPTANTITFSITTQITLNEDFMGAGSTAGAGSPPNAYTLQFQSTAPVVTASVTYNSSAYPITITDSLRSLSIWNIDPTIAVHEFGAAIISADGLFQYEAPQDWNGSFAVTFESSDGNTTVFDVVVEPVDDAPYVLVGSPVALTADEGEVITFGVNDLFAQYFRDDRDVADAADFGGVYVKGTRYTQENGNDVVVAGYSSYYHLEVTTDNGLSWTDLQPTINSEHTVGVYVSKDATLRIRPIQPFYNTVEYPNPYNFTSFTFELYQDSPDRLTTTVNNQGSIAIDSVFTMDGQGFTETASSVSVSYSFTPVASPSFPQPENMATVTEDSQLFLYQFRRFEGRGSAVDGNTNPVEWKWENESAYAPIAWSISSGTNADGSQVNNWWRVESARKAVVINDVHVADVYWKIEDTHANETIASAADALGAVVGHWGDFTGGFATLEVEWVIEDFNGSFPRLDFRTENTASSERRDHSLGVAVNPRPDTPVVSANAGSFDLTIGDASQDLVSLDGAVIRDAFRNAYSDARDEVPTGEGSHADAMAGILITKLNNVSQSSIGTWEFKTPGGNWARIGDGLTYNGVIDIDNVLADPGVWLTADTRLRFKPFSDQWLGESVEMTFQVLDVGAFDESAGPAYFTSFNSGDTHRYQYAHTSAGYVLVSGGGESGLTSGSVTIGGSHADGSVRVINTTDDVTAIDDYVTGTEGEFTQIQWGNGVLGVLENDIDFDGNAFDPSLPQGQPLVQTFTVAGVDGIFPAGTQAIIPGLGGVSVGEWGTAYFNPSLNANFVGAAPTITYTLDNGATANIYFTLTDVNDPAVGTISIGSIAAVGVPLYATVEVTDVDGLANANFSYEWRRDNQVIEGATSSVYIPTSSDSGAVIKAIVRFTDDHGNQEELTSFNTLPVTTVTHLAIQVQEDESLSATSGMTTTQLFNLTGESSEGSGSLGVQLKGQAANSGAGEWFYSLNSGATWQAVPTNQPTVLSNSAAFRIAFRPSPDSFGESPPLLFNVTRDWNLDADLYALTAEITGTPDAPLPVGGSALVLVPDEATQSDFPPYVLPGFSDPDGTSVNVIAEDLPDWLVFDADSMTLGIADGKTAPAVATAIEFSLVAIDVDDSSVRVTQSHKVIVQGEQVPPSRIVVRSFVATTSQSGDSIASLSAVDNPLDTHTFTVAPSNDGSSFSVVNNDLIWASATAPESGRSYLVTIIATDNYGNSFQDDFFLAVTPQALSGPVIESSSAWVESGRNIYYEIILSQGYDLDGLSQGFQWQNIKSRSFAYTDTGTEYYDLNLQQPSASDAAGGRLVFRYDSYNDVEAVFVPDDSFFNLEGSDALNSIQNVGGIVANLGPGDSSADWAVNGEHVALRLAIGDQASFQVKVVDESFSLTTQSAELYSWERYENDRNTLLVRSPSTSINWSIETDENGMWPTYGIDGQPTGDAVSPFGPFDPTHEHFYIPDQDSGQWKSEFFADIVDVVDDQWAQSPQTQAYYIPVLIGNNWDDTWFRRINPEQIDLTQPTLDLVVSGGIEEGFHRWVPYQHDFDLGGPVAGTQQFVLEDSSVVPPAALNSQIPSIPLNASVLTRVDSRGGAPLNREVKIGESYFVHFGHNPQFKWLRYTVGTVVPGATGLTVADVTTLNGDNYVGSTITVLEGSYEAKSPVRFYLPDAFPWQGVMAEQSYQWDQVSGASVKTSYRITTPATLDTTYRVLTVDGVRPVLNVESLAVNGNAVIDLRQEQPGRVYFSLSVSEEVFVEGVPALALSNGGAAHFAEKITAVDGTQILRFAYEPAANSTDSASQDLALLELMDGAGSVRDLYGNAMVWTGGPPLPTGVRVLVQNISPVIAVETGDSDSVAFNADVPNGTLQGSGTLTITDPDASQVVTWAVGGVTTGGVPTSTLPVSLTENNNQRLVGLLTLGATTVIDSTITTGQSSWTFNSGSEDFAFLDEGETLTLTYKLVATDSDGATGERSLTITIAGAADAPRLDQPIATPQSTDEDVLYTLALPEGMFVDPDASTTLTLTASLAGGGPLPTWLSFNPATRTLSGTPTNDDVGLYSITVTASDGVSIASDTFELSVANTNDPPVVVGSLENQVSLEDAAFSYTLPANLFADVDGDALTYAAELSDGNALPAWLAFDPNSGVFSGTPVDSDVGLLSINVLASDGSLNVSAAFAVTIVSVSDAPSGADTTLTVLEDASHTFAAADFGFTDPNDSPAGTLVSVTITTLPSGGDLKLNDVAVTAGQVVAVADLGNLVYTPAADANGVGYDSLTFQVQDNGGTADGGVDLDPTANTITFDVTPINDPPQASSVENIAATAGEPVSVTVPPFIDFDLLDAQSTELLLYVATLADGTDLPSWLSFNADTLLVAGTPPKGEAANLRIKIAATDQGNETASLIFELVESDTSPPDAPVVTIDPAFDSGVAGDGVTNVTQPVFRVAVTEAPLKVIVYQVGVNGELVDVTDLFTSTLVNGELVYALATGVMPLDDAVYRVYTSDNAGNRSLAHDTFRIDTTPPEVVRLDNSERSSEKVAGTIVPYAGDLLSPSPPVLKVDLSEPNLSINPEHLLEGAPVVFAELRDMNGALLTYSDGTPIRFNITDIADLEVSGQFVNLKLKEALAFETRYQLVIPEGAFVDPADNQSIVSTTARTTFVFETEPYDIDGVDYSVEDASGAPNGDLNADGIPDKLQTNVSALPWVRKEDFAAGVDANPDTFISLQAGNVTGASRLDRQLDDTIQIANVAVMKTDDSAFGGVAFPDTVTVGGELAKINPLYDPIQFTLRSRLTTDSAITAENPDGRYFNDLDPDRPGTQVRAFIDLPAGGLAADVYLKWNPTLNAGLGGWFAFNADGDINTYDDGAEFIDMDGDGLADRLVLTFTDGSEEGGDTDGIKDGQVVDPGVPGRLLRITAVNGSRSENASIKSVREGTVPVHAFVAVGFSVSWSLSGPDASNFSIDDGGNLAFVGDGAPPIDLPADSDSDNNYVVVITATDLSDVTNATSHTLTVTVIEGNSAPSITVDVNDSDSEDTSFSEAVFHAEGSMTVEDSDRRDVVRASVEGVTASGSTDRLQATNDELLTLFTVYDPDNLVDGESTTGTIRWSFNATQATFASLADGEEVSLTYVIRVTDPSDASAAHAVTVRVVGMNDAPIPSPVERLYTDTTVADRFTTSTGMLTGTDPDGDQIQSWGINGGSSSLGLVSKTGQFGRLFVNSATGVFVYEPNQMKANSIIADAVDVFSITASDGSNVGGGEFRAIFSAAVDTPVMVRVSGDSGISQVDRITSDSELTVSGLGDPGASVQLFSHGTDEGSAGTEIGHATIAPGGIFSIAATALSEGTHSLSLVSDAAGTQSERVWLGTWEIDQTAPVRPIIDTANSADNNILGTAEPFSSVSITFSTHEGLPLASFTATTDASGLWAIDTTSDPVVRGSALPATGGVFTVSATATDRAGNTSASTQPTPHNLPSQEALVAITSPTRTADSVPVFTGTGPEGEAVWVYVDDVLVGTSEIPAGGNWTFSTPTMLDNGLHDVRAVLVRDGVPHSSSSQKLAIDNTVPTAPAITAPEVVNSSTPTITGTAPLGTTVSLTFSKVGETPKTIYRTPVANDGTWSVELGRTIPDSGVSRHLEDGEYDVEAVATSEMGVGSTITVIRLTVDTLAPEAPVITIPTATSDPTPVLHGTAEPNSLVRVIVGEVIFETTTLPNGTWSIDTGTTATTSGTHVTFTESVYQIWAEAIDEATNPSPQSSALLLVGEESLDQPPTVVSLLASFGDVLSQPEATLDASVFALFAAVEDNQSAELQVRDQRYYAMVSDGIAQFTVPSADLRQLAQGGQEFIVEATNAAGTTTGEFTTPFTVDTSGPSRPVFVGISSTGDDLTPEDPFTRVTQPTVYIEGEVGQTPVIRGPIGIVSPASYATTEEPDGRYTIQFLVPLKQGAYYVNLRDENGNENGNGEGEAAQNYFRIDSVPVLYDQTLRRLQGAGRVYGNLGVMNTLNGQLFPVAPQDDGTWIDLDGERLTMGIVGGARQSIGGKLVSMEVNVNGATLSINTDTGAYIYKPLAGTLRIDRFPLFLRDESGNVAKFILSFDSEDYLDRDGIASLSETTVAGVGGDRNLDGVEDAKQNSVTTLTWGREEDFTTATNPLTADNFNPLVAATIVVNTIPFQRPSEDAVSSLEALMLDVDPNAQLLDISVVSPSAITGISPDSAGFARTTWDTMRYSIESLISVGLTDVMPWREGTQVQVAIDVSAAGIELPDGSAGGLRFDSARKFVSQATIEAYAVAGVDLVTLDGTAITTQGWYDFTARDVDNDGMYDTDGAIFVDFQTPGQIGYGTIDAIVMILTDNAFGDDDPTMERIVDPVLPGVNNSGPVLEDTVLSFVDTPYYDRFSPTAGQLAASDRNGDALTYGITGGMRYGQYVTASNSMGQLRVDISTGAYTFTPRVAELNSIVGYGPTAPAGHGRAPSTPLDVSARGSALHTFATTVSDGRDVTAAAFIVRVDATPTNGVTGDFLLGTRADVHTLLTVYEPDVSGPTVEVPQSYIQFTLYDTHGALRKEDLEFYANGRLMSLRAATLTQIATDLEANSVTYRLVGMDHLISASSKYFFKVNGVGGGIATTWDKT